MGIDFGNGNVLTTKEFIELRLKCLEIYVNISSKSGIEKSDVLKYAQEGWNDFVVKPLAEQTPETTRATGSLASAPEAKNAKSKK